MGTIPVRFIQDTTKEPLLSGSFAIRTIESLSEGKDMVENLHRHDFFYVLVIKSGTGSHEIDFIPYHVTNNSIFFMKPGQVHRLTLKAGSTGYLLQFKNGFFPSQELLRKLSHKKICTLADGNGDRLIVLLEDMVREFTEEREGYREVIKANLSIFFIELLRLRRNNESKTAAASEYPQEKLDNFFEMLDTGITQFKQVTHYADALNLSTYQLGAITRSLLDKTPSDIISEHIILEAKRQLLATSGQVNQIAYYLGYDDPSYFIRFFKKHTGHSPESFRIISK
ncbi:AraC family transcriptional regulator [Flavobacterium cerinum]|uniref:Helix-turn-helix domain-containing protein n=1 Tax=Flavobacterium cerinum TaxID=2502784 RepID=A0A444HCA5_9FLAO|nr:helix-turn-helix transcriptional regulator [Flavobacterium cerinum]RWX01381.1 helix-turn-helix domain-containing protein [Flavobacterium cerinum]